MVVSAAIDYLFEPVAHVGSSDGSQSGRAKGREDVSPEKTLVLVSSARDQRASVDQTRVEPRLHVVGKERLAAALVGGEPFAFIGLKSEAVVTSLGLGGKRTRVPLHPAIAGNSGPPRDAPGRIVRRRSFLYRGHRFTFSCADGAIRSMASFRFTKASISSRK